MKRTKHGSKDDVDKWFFDDPEDAEAYSWKMYSKFPREKLLEIFKDRPDCDEYVRGLFPLAR